MSEIKEPLIIAFIADLFFAIKVEDACQRIGFRVEFIERLSELQSEISPEQEDIPPRQFAEHTAGPGAVLMEEITSRQPSLLIFDLNNAEIPWRQWIPLVKSAPATRRIPVVCFGSHMDAEAITAARDAGADAVMARSKFTADLPALIRKYARIPDKTAILEACSEPLSELAIQGLELFNRGEYFEAHESLEHAWNEDISAGRELYRAILQVAVAYLQIQRCNYRGALKMFLRMRQWLAPLPESCRGVDVAALRKDSSRVYEQLIALGPDRLGEFDSSDFQPVRYDHA